MIYCVAKDKSLFHPGKTHLYHLFIDIGYSHPRTSGIIVFSNVVVIGFLFLIWMCDTNADMRVYFSSGIFLFGVLLIHGEHGKSDGCGSPLFRSMSKRGQSINFSVTSAWQFIRCIVYGHFLGGSGACEDASVMSPASFHSRLNLRIR